MKRLFATAFLLGSGFSGVNAGTVTPNNLPQGGQVVGGNAAISQAGSTMKIAAQGNTLVNWNQFNIAQNNSVHHVHSTISDHTVHNVVGADMSKIAGTLSANMGNVTLVNPHGIVFQNSAVIDMQMGGNFTATTAPILDTAAFMKHGILLLGTPQGSITHSGLTFNGAGLTFLAGNIFGNRGIISGTIDTIKKSGAKQPQIALHFMGDRVFGFGIEDKELHEKLKTIKAERADGKSATADLNVKDVHVLMDVETATKMIDDLTTANVDVANNMIDTPHGVRLIAAESITVAGTIDAPLIQIVALLDVTIEATAKLLAKEGQILLGVGSKFNAYDHTAQMLIQNLSVKGEALFDVSTVNGSAGRIAILAKESTYGSTTFNFGATGIGSASGGSLGFWGPKLPGRYYLLSLNGAVPHGTQKATLVMDPDVITIVPNAAVANLAHDTQYVTQEFINTQLKTMDVGITTNSATEGENKITLKKVALSWNTNTVLSLIADSIYMDNSSITHTGTGALHLRSHTATKTAATSLITGTGSTINMGTNGMLNTYSAAAIGIGAGITVTAEAANTTKYALLYNSVGAELNSMSTGATKRYALGENITLTENWTPIGTATGKFKGHLTGTNNLGGFYTISGLYIDAVSATNDGVGLLGYTEGATISNLGIITPSINVPLRDYVGTVAGHMTNGKIRNVFVTRSAVPAVYDVIGKSYVGGLVGLADETASISLSSSAVNVQANEHYAGGMAGSQRGRSQLNNVANYGNILALKGAGGLTGQFANPAGNDEQPEINTGLSTGILKITGLGEAKVSAGGIIGSDEHEHSLSWASVQNALFVKNQITIPVDGANQIAGGHPLTEEKAKLAEGSMNMFASLMFDEGVWNIVAGQNAHPTLKEATPTASAISVLKTPPALRVVFEEEVVLDGEAEVVQVLVEVVGQNIEVVSVTDSESVQVSLTDNEKLINHIEQKIADVVADALTDGVEFVTTDADDNSITTRILSIHSNGQVKSTRSTHPNKLIMFSHFREDSTLESDFSLHRSGAREEKYYFNDGKTLRKKISIAANGDILKQRYNKSGRTLLTSKFNVETGKKTTSIITDQDGEEHEFEYEDGFRKFTRTKIIDEKGIVTKTLKDSHNKIIFQEVKDSKGKILFTMGKHKGKAGF